MADFTSLGAILFSLAILGYYLFFYRRGFTNQRLVRAVDFLRQAIYLELHHKFGLTNPPDQASRLAATVVNEAFGFDPPDEEARTFRNAQKSAVQAGVAGLAADRELRLLIGAALRVMDGPAFKNKPRPSGGMRRAFNLGLVDPLDEELPPHKFLARTAAFHRAVQKKIQKNADSAA